MHASQQLCTFHRSCARVISPLITFVFNHWARSHRQKHWGDQTRSTDIHVYIYIHINIVYASSVDEWLMVCGITPRKFPLGIAMWIFMGDWAMFHGYITGGYHQWRGTNSMTHTMFFFRVKSGWCVCGCQVDVSLQVGCWWNKHYVKHQLGLTFQALAQVAPLGRPCRVLTAPGAT